MALDVNSLVNTMSGAAAGAFQASWGAVKDYALPELRKIAETFVDLEKGLHSRPPIYTRESADVVFRMQLRAAQAVLTATTALTLIAIEQALNQILAAVKELVNSAVGFGLV